MFRKGSQHKETHGMKHTSASLSTLLSDCSNNWNDCCNMNIIMYTATEDYGSSALPQHLAKRERRWVKSCKRSGYSRPSSQRLTLGFGQLHKIPLILGNLAVAMKVPQLELLCTWNARSGAAFLTKCWGRQELYWNVNKCHERDFVKPDICDA